MEIDEEDLEVNISFPIAFGVFGTPVSFQSGSPSSKRAWKKKVYEAARTVVNEGKWASEELLSITIYDFPTDQPQGDVDNIVKLIQDAFQPNIY